jgi:hypothetical protein
MLLPGCNPFQECQNEFDCPATHICGRDKTCVEIPGACKEGDGSISGKVTAPDGETPVSNAVVTVDGQDVTITTGPDGAFKLEDVPTGNYTIKADNGKYDGEKTVTVCHGVNSDISIPVAPGPHSMAVVAGDYDSIEVILANMGFIQGNHFDLVAQDDLADAGTLDGYEFLFLNCTNDPVGYDPAVQSNLQDFVNAGGGLYASDWAYEYVDGAFPGQVVFPASPKSGEAMEIDGQIVNGDLAAYMDKSEVHLVYDLGAWVVIAGAASADTVWVAGTYNSDGTAFDNAPLLVTFPQGEGKVTYTTFHNEAQVTQDMEVILGYIILNL